MERQHLHDFVARRRGCRQPEFETVAAGSQFAWTRQRLIQRPVIGHAIAQEPRLRDKRALGIALQGEIGLRQIVGIAMAIERDLRNDAAQRVDLDAEKIGADRRSACPPARHRPLARLEWRASTVPGAAAVPARSLPGAGRSLAAAGAPGAVADFAATGGGGLCSLLPRVPQEQRGERKNDKKDKALNVHRNHNVGPRGKTSPARRLRNGVVAPGMVGMTAPDALDREPGAAQCAMPRNGLLRVVGTARRETAIGAEHRPQQVLISADQREKEIFHRSPVVITPVEPPVVLPDVTLVPAAPASRTSMAAPSRAAAAWSARVPPRFKRRITS